MSFSKPGHRKLIAKAVALALTLASANLFAVSPESESQLIKQAQEQLAAFQPAEAYALMSQNEFQYAGSYRFDYVLGMSALAAGKYSEATIAFERVLVVKPGHIGAMLDMGIAYLKMGNRSRAAKQFEDVLASNPSENFRVLADEGLKKAQTESPSSLNLTRDYSGYLAMSLGLDSNINSATSSEQVTVFFNGFPVLLNINPSSLEESDQFAKLTGGLTYQAPVSEKSQWVFDLDGLALLPFNATENRNLSVNGNIAYQQFEGDQRWSVGGSLGNVWLDNDDYLQQRGLFAGWRSVVNDSNLADVTGYYRQYRYEDSGLSINDFDQYFVNARLIHRVPGKSLIASAGVLVGYEEEKNGRADGDNVFFGLSAGLQGDTRYSDVSFINVSFKNSDYDKENTLFNKKREDNQYDINAGMIWELEDSISLTGEFRYTKVDSNIDIYSYERAVTSLTLRKDFN